MEFWDREREIGYLKRYLQTEPNAILFVYGPKSSGKSTLLERVIEELREEIKDFQKKYQVYWFDLRGIFIPNYESVVDIFFLDEETEFAKERVKETSYGIKDFFQVKGAVKEEMKSRLVDPFKYMERELERGK